MLRLSDRLLEAERELEQLRVASGKPVIEGQRAQRLWKRFREKLNGK